MVLKKALFLVEGDDDKKFFERIISPQIKKYYQDVLIRKHIGWTINERTTMISDFQKKSADIFVISDFDKSSCITNKIDKVRTDYNIPVEVKIFIVKKEIESWYLAGINDFLLNKHSIQEFNDTENLSKKFLNTLSKRNGSLLEFKLKILNNYSLKTGISKNSSLKYCSEELKISLSR
jgi:hypothetical protein